MTKSSVPVKSRGILLFAFNTEKTDYVTIAERSARLIHHTLDLPVTLVTERDVDSDHFDTTIYVNNTLENYKVGEHGIWRNGDRWRAYELSPYDETLLIDTDYLMLDRNLLKLFEQNFDYRIMSWNNKPATMWNLKMGIFSHEYLWATAVLFRKTTKARMLFDLVGRIQRNYDYYRRLYHMREGNFRNDYAFTIANNILNGYDLNFNNGIVTPMLTFADITTSITTQGSMLVVKEKEKAYVIPRQNIHVMDKGYLLSDNFAEFIDTVCAE